MTSPGPHVGLSDGFYQYMLAGQFMAVLRTFRSEKFGSDEWLRGILDLKNMADHLDPNMMDPTVLRQYLKSATLAEEIHFVRTMYDEICRDYPSELIQLKLKNGS